MIQNILKFDSIPLGGVFTITLIFVIFSIEIGYQIGARRWTFAHVEKVGPVSSMVGSILALLALLLAFTFGYAATKFEERKNLVVEEANAIQTAYLRASLVSQSHKKEIKNLLREYINIRLHAVDSGNISPALTRSTEIHQALWKLSESANQTSPQAVSSEIFSESINEVINTHAKRLQIAQRGRIPVLVWIELYLVTFLSLSVMGYHNGLSNSRRSLAAPVVALTFASVLYFIADLDHPQEGMLQVSQKPLENVLQFIEGESKN